MSDDEVKHLRELMDERFVAIEKEQQLAYTELQRRLMELNHAHENMVKDRTEFLRTDTHNRFYSEYTMNKDYVSKEISEVKADVSNMQGRATATVTIIGFVFLGLQILLAVVIHYWK